MRENVSSSFKKKEESAYFNILKFTVTRLLPSKFVYKNSKKHVMCTNQVILSKITTEPPKTKQKFEIWSKAKRNVIDIEY